MDLGEALNAILATENPLTILLAIVILVALVGGSFVGVAFVRAIAAAVPLIGNLVDKLDKVTETLHELSTRIGDQLDALRAIDDGTRERTAKGIAVILEHNERAFATLRQQMDDNHKDQLAAMERLRLEIQMQGTSRRLGGVRSEQDKET